jgi:hypothetical protein
MAALTGRIDEGLNDWSFRVQETALRALEQDPLAQQADDIPNTYNSKSHSKDGSTRYPEQSILSGTLLRDKILRAFQKDYTPREADQPNIETTQDGVVPVAHEMKPTDLDATPTPAPPEQEGESILADNQLIQSWTKRYRSTGKVVSVEGDPKVGLNDSQMRAIALMLSERLSLVQGVSLR